MLRPHFLEVPAVQPVRSAHGQLRRRPEISLSPHDSQRICSTFVLFPAGCRRESMGRLGGALANCLAFDLIEEILDLTDDPNERGSPQHSADMIGVDLHRPVDLVVKAARRAGRDNAVAPRPEC